LGEDKGDLLRGKLCQRLSPGEVRLKSGVQGTKSRGNTSPFDAQKQRFDEVRSREEAKIRWEIRRGINFSLEERADEGKQRRPEARWRAGIRPELNTTDLMSDKHPIQAKILLVGRKLLDTDR
jgi:hypothetical protein